ncbi:PIG-L family deacetylase [Dactylosporangium roseum]|uniref:PIG-L family deacetylase n=1 Tax=Dactylosporangium roseum TaxID=47989 RepID=A0ABY5ZB62_9ACTN|nr:PIG-L family deacetylase [Dactylosporangium roseum]
MVIAADPDDAEYSFGATAGRLASEGTHVVYVIYTNGSQGGADPDEPAASLIATRYAELRPAAARPGVANVEFLGFHDGCLTADPSLRETPARQIRRYRPELALAHRPLRSLTFPIGASHPDHLAAGEAALSAVHPDARSPRAEATSEPVRGISAGGDDDDGMAGGAVQGRTGTGRGRDPRRTGSPLSGGGGARRPAGGPDRKGHRSGRYRGIVRRRPRSGCHSDTRMREERMRDPSVEHR